MPPRSSSSTSDSSDHRTAAGILAAASAAMGGPAAGRGACLAALLATAFAPAGAAGTDFGASYTVDVATDTVRVVVTAATLLVICLSVDAIRAHLRETEFYVLLLLAALGTIMLAGANDLLLLFAAYLLASVPGYALAGFRKDAPGTEAAMKYYLIAAWRCGRSCSTSPPTPPPTWPRSPSPPNSPTPAP
jgi:NADH:ubiquinone oxidoreductase subunit 2 (subunit N)